MPYKSNWKTRMSTPNFDLFRRACALSDLFHITSTPEHPDEAEEPFELDLLFKKRLDKGD
jgi:hypothetical protein